MHLTCSYKFRDVSMTKKNSDEMIEEKKGKIYLNINLKKQVGGRKLLHE